MEEFFKPTLRKIFLFFAILILITIIPAQFQKGVKLTCEGPKDMGAPCSNYIFSKYGFPVFFYQAPVGGDVIFPNFSLINFFINLLEAYILSCLVFYIFKKK